MGRSVAQLAAATKICLQPDQNVAATKRATNMVSGDIDDDVILIAGVLLSGGFVNECKKKTNKRKRSIWTRRWIEQRENTEHITARYKAKSKQTRNRKHR